MFELELLKLLFQAIVAVSFLGSLIIAAYHLNAYRRASVIAATHEIMDDYYALIENRAFEKYEDDLNQWKNNVIESEFNTGTFYYNNVQYLSRIGQFYDHVGLMVYKKLIDIDLLFEILPFPDKFWEDCNEFRTIFREASYNRFWYHFEYLRDLYVEKRAGRSAKDIEKILKRKGKV